MSWRTGAVAGGLLCAVVACAPPTSSSDEGSASLPGAKLSDIDVGTPKLVRLRKSAGIDVCPRVDRSAGPADAALPQVSLPCLGGGPDVELSALRGEPTVVNLWASWCGPCEQELPLLQRLNKTGKVRMLGIDFQDPQPGTAIELARDSGVTYPSVADPAGEVAEPLRMVGLPVTVFVRPDGRIAETVHGEYTSYGELEADVREHLGVTL